MSDFPFDVEPETFEPVYLDRSTLEGYTRCPFSAWAVETGKVDSGSVAADSGSEAHDVIAEAVDIYATEGIPPKEQMDGCMMSTRADIQPDVIEALKRSTWLIQNYLTNRNPADILLYDGGQGKQSGQLSWPILPANKTRGEIRPTSEVDLLIAGESADEVYETDWKTGQKVWYSSDVKKSFQFQMHSWLVFKNYPGVQKLYVRVFMTRKAQATSWVLFERKNIEAVEGRLGMAIEARRQAMELADKGKSIEIPCWCHAEACAWCPAVHLCPKLKGLDGDNPTLVALLADDPETFVQRTIVLTELLERRQAITRMYVDEHGEIEGKELSFGLKAPTKVKKPTKAMYKTYNTKE